MNSDDLIRDTISARAESLGLTAYAISKACGGSPNPEATKRYLTGRCSLNTRYVSQICAVVGLELMPKVTGSDHQAGKKTGVE